MTRRELIACLLAAACSRAEKPNDTPVRSPATARVDAASTCGPPELYEWTFDGVAGRAAILAPAHGESRVPVLVALHGRGEALKGPQRGALGWPNDYALKRALTRVCSPPLTAADFERLVTDEHLAELNQGLGREPWRGLVVACPYVPDMDTRRDSDVSDYGRFLTNALLPRLVHELPLIGGPKATGIDGVSLGGAIALRVGLGAPETFGAVGALQPAIDAARVADLVALARSARAQQTSLSLRITTSHDDVYRDVTRALSAAWREAGVAHDFGELPGPHDYRFNRGAGAYEMLLWHAHALARG